VPYGPALANRVSLGPYPPTLKGMSLPLGPTSSPDLDESEGSRSSDIPLWLIFGLVALMVVGAGLAGVAVLHGKSDKDSGPSYPEAWDSRIAPYAKIAEKERGLTFMHPVAVRFLPAEKFEKEVRTDESELDKEDRAELDQTAGLLRALGLLSGDVDLFDAFNDAYGSGTLAYYSFDDERVTVRGEKVTPAMRSTLVHELTHALQDQHFAVGDRMEKLRKAAKKDDTETTESSVLDAIVEGDARRVETLYRESLSAKQRKALDKSTQDEYNAAIGKLKKVPKVILTMISSPYTFGEALTRAVAEDGGNAAVDALFRDTPTHDSVLLDPFEILTHDTRTADVEAPALEDGEKKFDAGEFGAVTWYFMLAERLPILDALSATDGWGGDAYVAFERDGTSCARISYAGDDTASTRTMYRALQRWTAAGPRSSATVTLDGDRVHFESCDPGTSVRVGNDKSENALELAALRTYLGAGIVKAGAPAKVARCVSDRLVHEYSLPELTAKTASPAIQARVQQIVVGCR
jgi:hypothetical protein